MPKQMNFVLTPEVERALQTLVERGGYATKSEAVRGVVLEAARATSDEEVLARRRAALQEMTGLLAKPGMPPYDPRWEDELYEGMDV